METGRTISCHLTLVSQIRDVNRNHFYGFDNVSLCFYEDNSFHFSFFLFYITFRFNLSSRLLYVLLFLFFFNGPLMNSSVPFRLIFPFRIFFQFYFIIFISANLIIIVNVFRCDKATDPGRPRSSLSIAHQRESRDKEK